MKGSPSLRSPTTLTDACTEFVVEIIPIAVVACLLGFVERVVITWCFTAQSLLLKLVLGVAIVVFGLMSLALSLIALLAIYEFVKDLVSRK